MSFPSEFYNYLESHPLIQIKGGTERDSFLNIWMVEVEGRIFARSWNKSARSWFTEFQKTGVGEIKYGSDIINVKGKKLEKQDPFNKLIDQAYLLKYTRPEKLKYAIGISQPEYADYTMEFFPA
ncbi:DUF2255 family protein [Gillisia marina]|uniref:DUF2255 family protein n=1 Tax=Gillisia marina TaxID=1167637 RepID=UPI00029A8E61|nr:DUF2255 family protein [Gillisia marina]